MPLPIFGGIVVYGGPYPQRPESMVGVNLAAEIPLPCDISLPIRNFSAPTRAALEEGIAQAIERLARGELLYAGCKFGFGRTGLFMACLAKACGVPDPIGWTRSHYDSRAVETEDQEEFVRDFNAAPLHQRLRDLGAFEPVARQASA